MSVIGIILAIVILSILIIIHEFGHYIVAKMNGVLVKEFSIGFGPRIVSWGKGETKFSLKAIPFGGSCLMLGAMEDEDDNTDDERSFDKKSVWARMSIILAGPVANVLLGFVLAVILTGTMGYDPAVVTSVQENSAAYEAGLEEGDVITRYDGTFINFGREIYMENYFHSLSADSRVKITYKRDGKKYKTVLTPTAVDYYSLGISYYADDNPAEISEVTDNSPVDQAGLKDGDIITSINGVTISCGSDISAYLTDHPLDGSALVLTYTHHGVEKEANVTPVSTTRYELGFTYNVANVKTGVLATLKYSLGEVRYQIRTVFESLLYLVSGHASLDALSGPVGIVQIVGDTYDEASGYGFTTTLLSMLNILMLLTVNLGVMNMLPIPALDGGKFLLLVVEAVIRKPIPKKQEGIVTVVGAALLILLMCVVLVNDITKFFR